MVTPEFRHSSLLLLGLLGAACLFDPADPEPFEQDPGCRDDDCEDGQVCREDTCRAPEPEPACADEAGVCTVNADCCDFDGSTEVGAGLCVGVEQRYTCTTVCLVPDDCASGCCATLAEESGYGACVAASACADAPAADQACLDGVAFFCDCGASVDVPCSSEDYDAYLASCGDPSSEVLAIFACFGGFASGGSCSAALDACAPEASVEQFPRLRERPVQLPAMGSMSALHFRKDVTS
jgi:hypothetical protein